MRILLLIALALVAMSCVLQPARAQVHRCIGTNGEPVFTDQPCGAQPSLGAGESANGIAHAGSSGAISNASGVESAGTGAACPRSPQALRDRMAVAFNTDDPNVLAGLIDWRGYDRSSATARLREFKRWLQQPLTGIEFEGPPDPSGALPGDADYLAADPIGITVLTQPRGDEASSSRNFGVTQRGGCWWLSF